MAAPTPNAVYNIKGSQLLFKTTYNISSGKALFVVANSNPSTPTGWTLARSGSYFKLFTRTADGTSTDNFGNYFDGVGLVFDSGVTEDYTSGAWDNASSNAPAPNGGSALSGSTDELVVVGINHTVSAWVDPNQQASDATPATTSGFTAGTSAQSPYFDGPYDFYGVFSYWYVDDYAVQTQWKALSTTTPGGTSWGSYFTGYDDTGGIASSYGYRPAPTDDFYSATLAFKAASGTAYTASASSTITATGTASMSNARVGAGSGTETATGTAVASRGQSVAGSPSVTASATASMSSTLAIAGSGTSTATGTAAASVTALVTIAGSATATATGTAGASSTQVFAGSATVTATGTAVGSIRPIVTVDGSGSITATGTTTFNKSQTLAASATATASATAGLISITPISGASTVTATATATLLITTPGSLYGNATKVAGLYGSSTKPTLTTRS